MTCDNSKVTGIIRLRHLARSNILSSVENLTSCPRLHFLQHFKSLVYLDVDNKSSSPFVYKGLPVVH